MKKLFLALFIFTIAQSLFSQNSPIKPKLKKFRNDTIVWKQDSLLKQTDFKARANGGSLGFTASGIIIYPSESGGALIFYVEAVFVKSKSFLAKNTDYVLKHEQMHFDITELYARKCRQMLKNTDFKKVKKIMDEITKIYNKVSAEWQKEQAKYDKETEHGLNPVQQQVWNDDVARRLKETEAFSETAINLAN
ncbi:MAG: DUF922 domain-containing protein [Bacteroidia bacterium]